MKSDIEIAQEARMKPIAEIAASLGLADEDVIPYGRYKAKINHRLIHKAGKQGKLVLVTAISPTPAGEGKTTTSVGLADAMNALGKKTMLCLREPSLGPVFGVKGGAAGGGYAQVVPMEDINLHFTGDLHAIGAANNLLAAMIDNSIQQGNPLNIDPRRITWKRCMDMNDRQLRFIVDGLGGKVNGVPREDHFMITVASEVMAILCLAADLDDLKKRFGDILVAYSYAGKPIYARDLHAEGAMTALMKDAIKPNMVQTLEGTPAFIHGGGQEEGTRSGTEATAQIAGFAKAAELRAQGLADKLAHMAEVKAYCREKLLSIDGVVAVGQGEAPHILMVSLVGYPSANAVTDLGSQGICLSAGSACHRGKLSHVVTALGLDKRTANGVLRVSFGPETTRADIDGLYQALLDHKNQRFPML